MAIAFRDTRLPEDLERGAIGGPTFSTAVNETKGGRETRNQNWVFARYVWQFGYGTMAAEDYRELTAFFLARRGSFEGFRFKDWTDYQALGRDAGPDFVGEVGQVEPDGAWRLVKTYAGGYERAIVKPVAGTIQLYNRHGHTVDTRQVNIAGGTDPVGDRSPSGAGTYSIDPNTGIVGGVDAMLRPTKLTSNQHLLWTGEFDIPVRFVGDRLSSRVLHIGAVEVPNLRIIELNYQDVAP